MDTEDQEHNMAQDRSKPMQQDFQCHLEESVDAASFHDWSNVDMDNPYELLWMQRKSESKQLVHHTPGKDKEMGKEIEGTSVDSTKEGTARPRGNKIRLRSIDTDDQGMGEDWMQIRKKFKGAWNRCFQNRVLRFSWNTSYLKSH